MLRQKYLALAEDKSSKNEVVRAGFFSQSAAKLLSPPHVGLVRSQAKDNLSLFLPPELIKQPLEEEASSISDSSASPSPTDSEAKKRVPDLFSQEPEHFTSWFGSGLLDGGPSVMRFSTHIEQKKKAYLKSVNRSESNSQQSKPFMAVLSEREPAPTVVTPPRNHRAFTFFAAELAESNELPVRRPTFCQDPSVYRTLRDNDGKKLILSLPSLETIKAKFR